MEAQQVFFGDLTEAGATRIIIDSDDQRSVYEGSFFYDNFNNVFGTLDAYKLLFGGQVVYRATDIGVDANPVANAVQSNDAVASIRYSLRFDDTLEGSNGPDVIFTDSGDDLIYANQGGDDVSGEAGNDYVYGNQGRDTLSAGTGDDWVFGGQDRDTVLGGVGNDFVYGNKGHDRLDAGVGNDQLFGGQGGDLLLGGAGDDDLWGGKGFDTLTGGSGADDFFLNGGGTDRITDFESGLFGDRITTFSGIDDYQVVGNRAGLAILWEDGNQVGTVIVEGHDPTQFSDDWIL